MKDLIKKLIIEKLLGNKPQIVEQPKGVRIMSTVKPSEPRNFNEWAECINKELKTNGNTSN